MACTLPPTGDPLLSKSGMAVAAKSYNAALELLVPLIVNGYADYFDVEWVADSGLTQNVIMLYKNAADTDFEIPRSYADQLDGVIESKTGLEAAATYDFWLRRETATEYGPWYLGNAVITAGWISDVNRVYRLTVEVERSGELVIYVNP